MVVSKIPNYVFDNVAYNDDHNRKVLDCANAPENGLDQILDCQGGGICSPRDCSNDFADNLLREESNLEEGVDGEASQMQYWAFMDDAISNCLNTSMTSSDCVSQTYEDPETVIPISDGMKEMNSCMHGTQEGNPQNTRGFQGNENHYHNVLSNLLKGSQQFILGSYFKNGSSQSSFVGWRKDGLFSTRVPQRGTHQRLLKKVLFEVAKMHQNSQLESGKNNDNSKPEADEIDRNHVLSERKRREKINERFSILGSLVPSGGKVDKVSVLDHTIEYLRELEKKIEELESNKEAMGLESTTQTKPRNAAEGTSNNYGPHKIGSTKKLLTNKRKACETDKTEPENGKGRLRDSSTDDIVVNVTDNDVLIEVRCSWNDGVLLEVMGAVRKLRMDVQTVQSSNTDGILSVTLNAKSKEVKAASGNVIRQAIQKVIRKC